jgi:hypothetical protein
VVAVASADLVEEVQVVEEQVAAGRTNQKYKTPQLRGSY